MFCALRLRAAAAGARSRTGYRVQVTGYRLQVTGYRLQMPEISKGSILRLTCFQLLTLGAFCRSRVRI
jgi:hypothetical protein